jgi:hypothetical protein
MKRDTRILLATLLLGAILATGLVSGCKSTADTGFLNATDDAATAAAATASAVAFATDANNFMIAMNANRDSATATALAMTPTATPTSPPTDTPTPTNVPTPTPTSTQPVLGKLWSPGDLEDLDYERVLTATLPSSLRWSRDNRGPMPQGLYPPAYRNLDVSFVLKQSAFRSILAPPLGSPNSDDYRGVNLLSLEVILTNQITVTSQVIVASRPDPKAVTSSTDLNFGDGQIPLGMQGGKPWGLEGVKGWTGTMTVEGAKQDFGTGYGILNDGPSNVILNVALQGQPGSIKPQLLTDQLKAFGIGMAKELANPGQAPKIPIDFLKVSGAIQGVDPKLKCQDDGTMPPGVYFGDQTTADRAAPGAQAAANITCVSSDPKDALPQFDLADIHFGSDQQAKQAQATVLNTIAQQMQGGKVGSLPQGQGLAGTMVAFGLDPSGNFNEYYCAAASGSEVYVWDFLLRPNGTPPPLTSFLAIVPK